MARSRKNSAKKRQAFQKNVAGAVIVIAVIATIYLLMNDQSVSGYKGKVVATVNGDKIYEQEVNAMLNLMLMGSQEKATIEELDKTSFEAIVREAAAYRLLVNEAEKKAFAKEDEFKGQVNSFRENLLRETLVNQIVQKNIDLSKVKERYAEFVEDLKDKEQYEARHILVKTKEEAQEVLKKLKRDKSLFSDLAKQKSLDGGSAGNGGSVGQQLVGSLDPTFENALLSLKIGQISGPVETQFGWHVIELLDRKPAQPLEFDQVKDRIANQLSQEAVKKYVNGLLNAASIEYKMTPKSDVIDGDEEELVESDQG